MTESRALVASGTDPDVAAAMVVYERLKPLTDALGVKDLSDGELQVFAMVAHHTGLDPFTKQIYAIKRGGRVTHQTGIDGYRASAERTKEYRLSDEATYELCECGDKDSPPVHPSVARVVVYRAFPDGVRPQTGVARWHELKPDHTKPGNSYHFQDEMWWDQPFGQLSKCAEANGLRKAFPRVFGGVYIAEEMERANTIEGEAIEVAPTAKGRMAERAAAAKAKHVEPVAPAEEAAAQPTETVTAEPEPIIEGEAVELPDPKARTFGELHPCKLHVRPMVQDDKGGWYCPDCKPPVR